MLATLCVFSCALATAQPPGASEWQVIPRLVRGQELVYRGTFTEEVQGNGVQFNRAFRLENRIFVLDTPSRGADLAIQTILKLQSSRPARGTEPAGMNGPSSVRLEVVRLDLQGKVVPDLATALTVPLEGPATVECGTFVEIPGNWIGRTKSWEVPETGRPPHSWRMVGIENLNGIPCLKLVGLQQSEDWDHPRADRTAWRRQDIVWIVPRNGISCKVERSIERREPAHREATNRSKASYELETTLVYPGPLGEDCQREIAQARHLAEAAEPYLRNPGKEGQQPLEALLARIAMHVDQQPASPYRASILQVKGRIEAALRGESASPGLADETESTTPVAAVGRAAPDFMATDLTTKKSARLSRLLGKPILMVFYNPKSSMTEDLLHFAQGISDKNGSAVKVLTMAISDNTPEILKQRTDLGLTMPVLAGQGLRITYGVESTPKLVILDGDGIVRGAYVGWGKETSKEVTEDLLRCFAPETKKKQDSK